MEIEQTDIINSTPENVYHIVRDHLSQIAEHLPNVKKIDQIQYQKNSSSTHEIINRWYANIDLPYILSKFVSEDLFSWKDTAIWFDDKKCVQYDLESFYANNFFSAKGANYFSPYGKHKTKLKVTCSFQINPENIPGIPRLMTKKLAPMIDKLVVKALAPNTKSLGVAIKSYLKEV